MGGLMLRASLLECETWDESLHLTAGYSYVSTGQLKLNAEHPVLFKILSAVPLLALNLEFPAQNPSVAKPDLFSLSDRFMYQNRVPPEVILFWGRSISILITLLLALLIALWTRRHFGTAPAMLALFLFALDPNFIAHGHYVTNDVLLSLFYFLTVVVWLRFLRTRRYRDLILASFVLGIALVTKYSALLLALVLPILYLVQWLLEDRKRRIPVHRLGVRHFAISMVVLAVISASVVAIVYWPETVNWRQGPRLNESAGDFTIVGSALGWIGQKWNLPAHPYVLGINQLASFSKDGHDQYLLGWHSKFGWWYYFPVAFLVKTTCAVLALLVFAVLAGLRILGRRSQCGTGPLAGHEQVVCWWGMAIPAVAFFALMMNGSIALGIRYLLPFYPLLYVLIAAAMCHVSLSRFGTARRIVIGSAIVIQFLEVGCIHPHYTAFFNAVAGGPGNGPHYLLDSNIDWGQDVKKLRRYLDSIGWDKEVCISYFGRANLSYYGIRYRSLPTTIETGARESVDCLAAVSVTELHSVYGRPNRYSWLLRRDPMAKVGYSIYVYDLRKNRTPFPNAGRAGRIY
jgi:hypothetical protein